MENERKVSWGRELPNLEDTPNGAVYIQTTDEPLSSGDEEFLDSLAAMFRTIPVHGVREIIELEENVSP
jgi:hypothetical protein